MAAAQSQQRPFESEQQRLDAVKEDCVRSARNDFGRGGWQDLHKGGCVTLDPARGRLTREPFSPRAVFAINAAYHQLQMHSVTKEEEYVYSATIDSASERICAIMRAAHSCASGSANASGPADSELYDLPPHRLRMDKILALAEPLFGGGGHRSCKHALALPEAHECAARMIAQIRSLAESRDWCVADYFQPQTCPGGWTNNVNIRMNPDWLPRDPMAAAPSKVSKTGMAFKHRMAVDRGMDARYAATGVFDKPKAPRYSPPGETLAARAQRFQKNFEEAQQRFAVVLKILSVRDKRDVDRCRDACIARARRSDLLYRRCSHLRKLCDAELEARAANGSRLVSFFASSQDFLDAVLPRIDPISGLRLMESCKAMYTMGKENNRGYFLEMVPYSTDPDKPLPDDERAFPAHHPPRKCGRTVYDKPQINLNKYVRLQARVCFRFMTSWTHNTWADDPNDAATDSAERGRILVASEEKLEMKDHVWDQAPAHIDLDRTAIAVELVMDDAARTLAPPAEPLLPVVELGSGSGQRASEWKARRLPKMRVAVLVQSNAHRPLAAYRLRTTLAPVAMVNGRSHALDHLVCYTEPFYVIGRAKGPAGKASKDAANRALSDQAKAHTAEYHRGLAQAEAACAWPEDAEGQ